MPLLSQAAALTRLVGRHPGALAALARWRPFSITSFEMARALRAQGVRPAAVVDGGANAGQFARAIVETFPAARVISFEPLPEMAARFREHLGGHPRVRLVESALGSTDGALPFFRSPYSLASSALPSASDSGEVERIEVPVARLDTALAGTTLPEPTLLKLDLQGFELEALRGAAETLRRVRHVLLEVGLRPSYVGEPPFEALYDVLRRAGFRFLRPVDVLRDPTGEIVQMDVLFERAATA